MPEEKAVRLLEQGNLLFAQRKLPAALKAYQRAIDLDPNYGQAWLWKGVVLAELSPPWAGMQENRWEEALEAFEQAKTLEPDNPQACYGTGWPCMKWNAGMRLWKPLRRP